MHLFKDRIDLRTSYTLRPRQAYMGRSSVNIRTTLSLGKTRDTSAVLDVVADFAPKWIMATFAACPASYFFVKTSILLFYLRVFQLQAKLRYIIYALFAYCIIYYWVAFFAIVGLCNVANRSWDITATMNCFAYGNLMLAIGSMDLVADVLVLAFPVPIVLKLQISRSQKVYLLFVFLAGIR